MFKKLWKFITAGPKAYDLDIVEENFKKISECVNPLFKNMEDSFRIPTKGTIYFSDEMGVSHALRAGSDGALLMADGDAQGLKWKKPYHEGTSLDEFQELNPHMNIINKKREFEWPLGLKK